LWRESREILLSVSQCILLGVEVHRYPMIAIDQKTAVHSKISICSPSSIRSEAQHCYDPVAPPILSASSSIVCSPAGVEARVRRYGCGERGKNWRSLEIAMRAASVCPGIVAGVAYLVVPSVATCVVVGLVSLFGGREICVFSIFASLSRRRCALARKWTLVGSRASVPHLETLQHQAPA
jgi:hypothetical protein